MSSRASLPEMNAPSRVLVLASLVLISTALTACQDGDHKGIPTGNVIASPVATPTPLNSGGIPPILLFTGTGTSPNDVAALETILHNNHFNYSTVNSSQLNQMGESQIRRYRLLIIPGGNFVDIGNSLTPSTSANIRNAVQSGLNYLGICAGAFFAGNSPVAG